MEVPFPEDRKKAVISILSNIDYLSAKIAHDVATQEGIYTLLSSPKSLMEIAYEKKYQNPEMLGVWLNKLASFGFLNSEPGSDLFQTPLNFPELPSPHPENSFASDLVIWERMIKQLAEVFPAKLRNEMIGVSFDKNPYIWDSLTSLESAETLRELIITQSRITEHIAKKTTHGEKFRILDLGGFTGNSTLTLNRLLPENIEITTVVHSTKYVRAVEATFDVFGITNAEVLKAPPIAPLTATINKTYDAIFTFHHETYISLQRIPDLAKLLRPSGSLAGFNPLRDKAGQPLLLEWIWNVIPFFPKYPMRETFRATLANSGFTSINLQPAPLWTFSAIRR
ncbi:MAG: hypothetical protein ACE5R6_12515 [Candidatus Heimdallarchaeota archaeon]